MKQTAIEWLEKRFYFTKGQLIDIDFEQAKAMEKEQIIDGYAFGHNDGCRYMNNQKQEFEHGEEYYKETYK